MSELNEHSVNWFAVMWCNEGLEAVQHIPDPKMQTWARLANQPMLEMPRLNHWRLRAQFNPQRYYEIYLISAEPGIDANDIRAMFEADPQTAADTCRRLGQQFYSGRNENRKVVIL
jgi:hypothetical protein